LEKGFETSSGKVEFYSELLEELGIDPLPVFVEPFESPSSSGLGLDYPLVLTTGAKLPMFTHSQFRNIPRLSKLLPENYFSINPVTAVKYGVIDGDEIMVESPTGRLSGPVRTVSDLVENVVQVFHGFNEMNANLLTSSDFFDLGNGSPGMKSSLCRIVQEK
jgi:anaerobic selenocysteine-containing dehydrogenase